MNRHPWPRRTTSNSPASRTAGRPLRERVAARVPGLRVAVEADGWEVLQRFVALGAGLTVVNRGVAKVPGVQMVSLRRPARVTYHAFWRPDVDARPWVATMFPP